MQQAADITAELHHQRLVEMVGRAQIGLDVLCSPHARDDGADRGMLQDVPQRELRHRHAFRDGRPEPRDTSTPLSATLSAWLRVLEVL